VMTLAGVVAYYISAPSAASPFARPVTERMREKLTPVIAPILALLRTWRAAKRLRTRTEGAPLARLGHAA